MVAVARLGQFRDDLRLPAAHRQAVLVEPHPVKGQGQGVDRSLDFGPDLVDGGQMAGQAGPPQFFHGRPDHRFFEGAHIRLGMDDGQIDQRPGITARETVSGPRVMRVALGSRHNPVSFSPPSTRSPHPKAAAGCLPSLAGGKSSI